MKNYLLAGLLLFSQILSSDERTGNIRFNCVTCTSEEEIKIKQAEVLANSVVQSDCFKEFMLNWGLVWTNGKTPEDVVSDIQKTQLEVPVHFYTGRCSVVGYRNAGKPDIYLNRCVHNNYSVAMTASNATHEWSHVLGYDHPFRRKSWRGRTVPYAINRAFEACASSVVELVTGLEPATDGLQNRSSTN